MKVIAAPPPTSPSLSFIFKGRRHNVQVAALTNSQVSHVSHWGATCATLTLLSRGLSLERQLCGLINGAAQRRMLPNLQS